MLTQFVAKFADPQTTEMMMGTNEKPAPYPSPNSALLTWNSAGIRGVRAGRAVLTKASRSRTADGSSSTSREKWKCEDGGSVGSEGGAKRSDSVPVKRRAKVLVSAMMETCVDALPASGTR